MPRGKKGYFFVIDAAIASIILLFGLFVVFGGAVSAPETTQSFSLAEDVANILLYQPLSDSTNTYYTSALLPNNLVPSPDYTAMEEIGYLVTRSQIDCSTCAEHAYNYSKNLIENSVGLQYGAAIVYNGTVIYNRSTAATDRQLTRAVLVYVRYNETLLIGPVPAEVRLW